MSCGRGESNPHARRHQILSLAWLPLHHSRSVPESRSSPRGCRSASPVSWPAGRLAGCRPCLATHDRSSSRSMAPASRCPPPWTSAPIGRAPPASGPRGRTPSSASCRPRPAWPPWAPSACWSRGRSSRRSGTATTDVRRDPVGPGQESVWDYPRPPSAEVTGRHVVLEVGGRAIADTRRAVRVCETSHPPVNYVPRDDVADGVLERAQGGSWCEWKGAATYWDVVVDGRRIPQAAWSYEDPSPGFEHLPGAVAFYPGKVDRAFVDGEPARAQAGGFYGGWITGEVAGPFKGEPGTLGW